MRDGLSIVMKGHYARMASLYLVLMVVLLLLRCPHAAALEILPQVESGRIVEKVEWVAPGCHARIILRNQIPNHWFLFAVRGTRGESAKIEVVGQDTVHNSFPWKGVLPVIADAADVSDPRLYDEVAFQRSTGRLPWRRITNAEFDGQRTMAFDIKLTSESATIALKFPCPVSYIENKLSTLSQKTGMGRLGIYEAGRSVENRPLRVITVPSISGSNISRWKQKPTFLVYGGEHPTEHESSQVVMGALDWLMTTSMEAQSFRNEYNVVLIPHLSPDDTVNSVFERVISGFMGSRSTWGTQPENVAWARFWNHYIEAGYRLDVAISLHNVAGSDAPNFFAPITQVSNSQFRSFAEVLHEAVIKSIPAKELKIKKQMGINANVPMRLCGWLENSFGVCGAFFEVNGQYPPNPLSLTQIQAVGSYLLKGCDGFVHQPQVFADQRARQLNRLAQRQKQKQHVLATSGADSDDLVPEWVVFNRFW